MHDQQFFLKHLPEAQELPGTPEEERSGIKVLRFANHETYKKNQYQEYVNVRWHMPTFMNYIQDAEDGGLETFLFHGIELEYSAFRKCFAWNMNYAVKKWPGKLDIVAVEGVFDHRLVACKPVHKRLQHNLEHIHVHVCEKVAKEMPKMAHFISNLMQ